MVRRRTEIVTDEGKLFLDSVLDMASRRGAGFGLGEHHDAGLAYAALAMAVAVRGGRDAIARVILHTDQDSEYTAGLTRAACNRLGITLDRRRQVLGEDHPHTRESEQHLAEMLRKLDESAQ